jgi:hypothetical protein
MRHPERTMMTGQQGQGAVSDGIVRFSAPSVLADPAELRQRLSQFQAGPIRSNFAVHLRHHDSADNDRSQRK